LLFITKQLYAQIVVDHTNFGWSRIENKIPVIFVHNDGELPDSALIKGIAATPKLQGIQYLLGGTPVLGETLNLEIKYFPNLAPCCRFKLQVYDGADSVVLSETGDLVAPKEGAAGIEILSTVFKASSVGYQIVVRFVRTDNLNPANSVTIDYLKVNSELVNMTPFCKPIFNFDLPLVPSTKADIDDFNTIIANYIEGKKF